MKERICIIGHFGGERAANNGQTVKTLLVEKVLKEFFGQERQIERVNTYYARYNPLLFWIAFIKTIVRKDKLIIMLSNNGQKILFPILYLSSKFLGTKVYHCAIGGAFSEKIKLYPSWKKYLSVFQVNWMEGQTQVRDLELLGIKNLAYLPNFKELNILDKKRLPVSFHEPYRFCMFSRLMREKGVSLAVKTILNVNEEFGYNIAKLDLYGPIWDDYAEELTEIIGMSEGTVRYCGMVDSQKSVDVLQSYFMLLFPTFYFHEGFPGTIIDSMAAGLPVIASKWQCCDEMLQHKINSYCYDFNNPQKLKEWITYAIRHPEENLRMREKCLCTARQYSAKAVLPQIVEKLNH